MAGSHITLAAHSKSVQLALDAAKQLEAEGVDCEVCKFECLAFTFIS